MSDYPLVSVIIPAYNADKYISNSIASVLLQTYTNWELLIIDDGSTDNTKDIVESLINNNDRIKYYWQPNGRQGKARNLGIFYSRGEYLAFLDADDVWLPEKLAIQIDKINSADADLIYSDSYKFSDQLDYTVLPKMSVDTGIYTGKKGVLSFLKGNKVPTLTVVVKKDAVKAVGGFTEDAYIQNAEDYHLWLKLLMSGYKLLGIPEALTAYRVHETSVSHHDKSSCLQVIVALYELSISYPEYKKLIAPFLKKWVKAALELLRHKSDEEFYHFNKRNLTFIGYNNYYNLVKIANKVLGRSFSIRLNYFILNYL